MGLRDLERFAVQLKGICDLCGEKAIMKITVSDQTHRRETLMYLSCLKHIEETIKDVVEDWYLKTQ